METQRQDLMETEHDLEEIIEKEAEMQTQNQHMRRQLMQCSQLIQENQTLKDDQALLTQELKRLQVETKQLKVGACPCCLSSQPHASLVCMGHGLFPGLARCCPECACLAEWLATAAARRLSNQPHKTHAHRFRIERQEPIWRTTTPGSWVTTCPASCRMCAMCTPWRWCRSSAPSPLVLSQPRVPARLPCADGWLCPLVARACLE